MTNYELMDLIGHTQGMYILRADQVQAAHRRAFGIRRKILLAAVIALILILAGCTVIFLGFQKNKVGAISVTRRIDDYGNLAENPEKTMSVISVVGFQNTPEQQAAKELRDFLNAYQPKTLDNNPNHGEIPNQFEYTYHCRDLTMVEKVKEIAAKYHQALLGNRAGAQYWQMQEAFERLGIAGFTRDGIADYSGLMLYPPYNFTCGVSLTLGEKTIFADYAYLKAGYLAPNSTFLYDPDVTQEWAYTAADGTEVILGLTSRQGIILTQNEYRSIVIFADLSSGQGVFLQENVPLPTREDLEQIADCFDYRIVTQAVPMEGLQEALDALEAPDADRLPANPGYSSFGEYLKANTFWPELLQYAWYDVDLDGQEDLLISYGDGFCEEMLGIRDGKVVDLTGGRGRMRLCEGGYVEAEPNQYWNLFFKLAGAHPESGIALDDALSVYHKMGSWQINRQEAAEAESRNRIAQFVPMKLKWIPLLDFPIDEAGTPLRDAIKHDVSENELMQKYRQFAEEPENLKKIHFFGLTDINQDGIEDLLLSQDGKQVDRAYTYKRGQYISLGSDFLFCKDNVLCFTYTQEDYVNGKWDTWAYRKLLGYRVMELDMISHYFAADIWTDRVNNQISQSDAQAIQEKYPPVDLDMRPISELLG